MLQQHIEKINEHVELLNERNAELEISKEAIAEIGKTDLRTELLVPIANGIFLKTELLDNQKVIVNVGADTTVEHSVDEVLVLLAAQQEEMAGRIRQAEAILKQFQEQAAFIYQEVASHEEEGAEDASQSAKRK